MATTEIIRFLRDDIGQTRPSDTSCNYSPIIKLINDVDGPRGKYGNIMTVAPNAAIEYEHVILKYNYYVDIATGGEIALDGFQLLDGDHVWLAAQLNPTTDGIYIVRTGAWEFYKAVTDTVFVDLGATATDSKDGNITRNIVIDHSTLNFSVTGFYSITYYSMNSAGILVSKVRKVKVVPENASISPVPGYSITNYTINTDIDTAVVLGHYGNKGGTPVDNSGGDEIMSTMYIRKDGTIVFVANQSMGGNRLVQVADPIDPQDAVNYRTLEGTFAGIMAAVGGLVPIKTVIDPQAIANVDSVDPTEFRTIKWIVEVTNPVSDTYYSTEVLFVNTTTGGRYNITGAIGDGSLEDFGIAVISDTSIHLQVSNLTNDHIDVSVIRIKCS